MKKKTKSSLRLRVVKFFRGAQWDHYQENIKVGGMYWQNFTELQISKRDPATKLYKAVAICPTGEKVVAAESGGGGLDKLKRYCSHVAIYNRLVVKDMSGLF